MPLWLDDENEVPYRPWAAVWISVDTGLANVKIAERPDTDVTALAVDALVELGLKFAQTRPTAIQVTDAALGAAIVHALGDRELAIAVVPNLDAATSFVERMAEDKDGPFPPPALGAPGVTVERMRAFAEAARDFHAAEPWRCLSDVDLVHVEAPAVDPAFRHLVVLGAGGHVFGLGFYASPEAFEGDLEPGEAAVVSDLGDRWTVVFGPPWETPFSDLDLWEREQFPPAGPSIYAVAASGPAGRMRRPDARELADLEAILRALARTPEADIDQGRWSVDVTTREGVQRVVLSIPALLEPIPPFEPVSGPREAQEPSALDRAQDLAYEAMDASGRRRIQLARQALELSPDCADAYGLLAGNEQDLVTALDLYRKAVAAGERALGPEVFARPSAPFWGEVRTRPYMRALFDLARCLDDLDRGDEALELYRRLLRLNPGDNQGARYSCLDRLLQSEYDAEAKALLDRYDDPSALWQYGWALWTFRSQGNSAPARQRLAGALGANRHVPGYLTGETTWPEWMPESYAMGSRDEAVVVVDELGDAWEDTPGAVQWIAANASLAKLPKPPRHGRRSTRH